MNKTAVEKALREGEQTIVFTRADGTRRTMRATLSDSLVPAAARQGEERFSDTTQVVYDLDRAGWRTFDWGRLSTVGGVAYQGGYRG